MALGFRVSHVDEVDVDAFQGRVIIGCKVQGFGIEGYGFIVLGSVD